MTTKRNELQPSATGPPRSPDYSPILVRTGSFHRVSEPAAFDCINVVVIRDGSALLHGEFGVEAVALGHVALLGANVRYTTEPDGHVTSTVVHLDPDYVADQIFWQYAHALHDRLDAKELFAGLFSQTAQVIRLGEDRVGMLMPWLDEMAALSASKDAGGHFLRMQALWLLIADVLNPHLRVTPGLAKATGPALARPTLPRGRSFVSIRGELLAVRDALHQDPARDWTLPELAATANLSVRQLTRVFSATFGKTPHAYLTMLRVERMAKILRETDTTVAEAGRRAGWRSRSRANEAFREFTGNTPWAYRESSRRARPQADAG
ncbi:AraC family transcriptional regulator [Microbacterium betulae]|uniref:AraC family transcriptional regulator n=2 Tax=Microbacterium TaxID=33882 RepID=A0AA97I5V9_9MICO|nr:AraC family transcriptional regulator [Microbacterium sp. AB]WOF21930.1 AraC family transcriptional regulator [Microbacterium sp. AB]